MNPVTETQIDQGLEVLYAVIRLLNNDLDLYEMLRITLPIICEVTSSPSGWVLLNHGANGFEVAATYALPPALSAKEEAAFRWGPCRCQQGLLAGELTQVVNIVECERLAKARGDRRALKYHASIPLQRDGQYLGLINLAFPAGRGSFNYVELSILTVIGDVLAMAVHSYSRLVPW